MTNEPAVGKCEGCGHIRYPEDLFDGDCVVCCLWAVNQLAAEKQRGDELQFTLDGRELSLKQVDDAYAKLATDRDRHPARVRKLERALKFYANEENWSVWWIMMNGSQEERRCVIEGDKGDIAREALEDCC